MEKEVLSVARAICHTRAGRKVAQDVYADLGTAFRVLVQFDKVIEMEEQVLLMTAQTGDKESRLWHGL